MTDLTESGVARGSSLTLDTYFCAAIAVMTGILTWIVASSLSFTVAHLDVWFDSDSAFIFEVMTDRWTPHQDRNNLHPIFALLTYPAVFVQTQLLGIDKYNAALVLLIVFASLWACLIYITLRLMRRPIGAALIFTAIGVASTGGVLFLGIFERHIAGSITILVCVAAFVAYERRMISGNWLVLAAAGTLGITITNFMVGIAALFLAFGPRKGLQASINAFFVVVMLAALPQFLFPTSSAFLDFRNLPFKSTFQSVGGTIQQRATAYWFHATVMPEPTVEVKPNNTGYLSLQRVSVANHRPAGYAALLLWAILVGMGAWRTFKVGPIEKVDILLALGILGHFCLFLFFGSETILYAPSYVPLILLVASRSLCSPSNLALYVASSLFLGLLAWNNVQWLLFSVASARSLF
ncbi:MAG: hypothetical protein JXM70_19785 [Pirellulales bacterium]|nr:hypothetical protein [Pirellulales bacterium]